MEPRDYSHHVREHGSTTVRALYAGPGTAFLALGVAGAFLPLLPSTPFMLLAAACYARSSARFYNWLLNHRAFGPLILEWREHHSIPWRTKLWAIGLMAATLATSVLFFVPDPRLQLALAAFGVLLGVYLYRIPSRDRPRG